MYFEIKKYNDNLYQLKDKLGVLVTLVIGRDKALLVDTAYGIGDLYKEVRNITDKELVVVNSHGHMDHSCGNYQFKEVYIHPKDIELCQKHNSKETRLVNLQRVTFTLPDDFNKDSYLCAGCGQLKEINYGDVIDLGGLKCEIINLEGHTKGSIGFYFKNEKLLITSDAICPFVWMFLEESTPLHVFKNTVKRTLKLDFEYFLVGHGAFLYPKERMYDFDHVYDNIDISKATKMSYFGFEELNSYRFVLDGDESCGIVFDKNKL